MSEINKQYNAYFSLNNLQSSETNSLFNLPNKQVDTANANQLELQQLKTTIVKETTVEVIREFNNSNYLKKNPCQEQKLVQIALQLVDDAVIITDASGGVLFLNPVAEKLTGWQLPESQYLPLSTVFHIVEETTFEIVENPIQKIFRENRASIGVHQAMLISRDNSLLPIEHCAAPIREYDQQIVGAVLVFRDVSKSRNLASELYWQVSHDSLTGLVNRSSFEHYLEKAVSSAKNLAQEHVLCYLDLDRFKVINDTCGHVVGDEVLRKISAMLQKRVRKTDVLARLGSDEFGLILYQCNLEQALNVVELLREEVQRFRFNWENQIFSFSISIGVAIINVESESSSSMLSAADSACYTAKSKGRNRFHLYQPNDIDVTTRRGEVQWVPRIFRALEENLFLLYCQQIIPVAPSQQIKGNTQRQPKYYEVLLRLQDEAGKIVSPGEFIPAAERYDLMHLLDRWVIRTLFAWLGKNDCQAGKHLHKPEHDCLYSINLSGTSLNDDEFLDFVQEQFLLHSIPPQIICFEITETVAISNLNKARQFIHQLKAIGCCFALDDFGSGMSSFGYLKSLPINYLKIDGIFIKDICRSEVDCEIVEAIHRIAHVMGIQTVAEWVENNEVLMKLRTLGIDYAQGYGIAKPCPLEGLGARG